MDDFEKAAKEIEDASAGVQKLDSKLDALREYRQGRDRTFIVKCVIWLYSGSVGVSILYLIYRGISRNEDTFLNISEVIKVSIIPIVTLVIGYYFGTAKGENKN